LKAALSLGGCQGRRRHRQPRRGQSAAPGWVV